MFNNNLMKESSLLINNEWKLSESFGGYNKGSYICEKNIANTLSFDKTGNYIALGDNSGRVIIFKQRPSKKQRHEPLSYKYYVEFQSHVSEFDVFKTTEIVEKINNIAWLRNQESNLYMLTNNDKIIKLWKVCERSKKKANFPNITWPQHFTGISKPKNDTSNDIIEKSIDYSVILPK